VKVGDTWAPDVAVVGPRFSNGTEVDAANSKIVMKLDKVYEKDGKKVAVLGADISIAINGIEDVGPNTRGHIELKGTIEFVLDGSSTAASTSLKGKIDARDDKAVIGLKSLNADLTLNEERFAESEQR